MTNLQPPVGTVIETREEAIRVLLLDYPDFFNYRWRVLTNLLKGQDGFPIIDEELCHGDNLPYTVAGVLPDFTPDPNYGKTKHVEMPDVYGVTSEGIDGIEALADEPLKHYVWVEGMHLPSTPHDTREDALKEALRLSPKERKRAFVITDVIVPVYCAERVELEKGTPNDPIQRSL